MPIYDKVESWKADDENDFTFLPDEGVIRWFHEVVDLVQICDKCLMSVHKALANSAKYDTTIIFAASSTLMYIYCWLGWMSTFILKASSARMPRETNE